MSTQPKVGIAAGAIKELGQIPIDLLGTVSHITLGSITLEQRDGNTGNVDHFDPDTGVMINALNLPNPGIHPTIEALQEIAALFAGHYAQFHLNLCPTGEGTMNEMCRKLAECHAWEHIAKLEINVACPNHRDGDGLHDVLAHDLLAVQEVMAATRPYVGAKILKIAPDMDREVLERIIELCHAHRFSGIVSSNTRKSESRGRIDYPHGGESGTSLLVPGVQQMQLLNQLRSELKVDIELTGCGGIMRGENAEAYFKAGADDVSVMALYWNYGADAVQRLVEELAFGVPA